MEELVNRQSQDRKVDLRDTLEFPVVGMCENFSVHLLNIFDHSVDQLFVKA